jgi:hypothetical protein
MFSQRFYYGAFRREVNLFHWVAAGTYAEVWLWLS